MHTDLDHIRKRLKALRADIGKRDSAARGDLRPIALDQQAVGRLSRIDSLQMQAMDKAQAARRRVDLRRIDAALMRMDAGAYGYCVECGEAIAVKRLQLDPATPRCAGCAR